MNCINLTKLRFSLLFTKSAQQSQFIGNTLRGSLGSALAKTHPNIYQKIFKTDAEESIPNPFVISAPYPNKREYQRGDELHFHVTLFGVACAFEEEIIDAATAMSSGKLLNTRLVECEQIYNRKWSDEGADSILYCDRLTINFLTPTEIFVKKEITTQIDFSLFIDRLFARISAIIDNYGESEFIIPYNLITKKPFVEAKSDLRRVIFQTNNQPINGILGKVEYFGDITRYLPYIDLGSQMHIGKKTTRSCGEYVFEIQGGRSDDL